MGEASRRKASGNYPEYKKLPPKIVVRRGRKYIIGHGKQIAIRDGRA